MDLSRFERLFLKGCLSATKAELTEEVLANKHLRTLALIEAGELATVQKQDSYAFTCGRNWSIDRTRATDRANRRRIAVGSVNEVIAKREGQIDLFLQALDLVEHTFIGRRAMMEGAEILRRLVGGEGTAELCEEFAVKLDALYQRVSRVRKAVLASGLVNGSELSLLFGERGNFRPAPSYEAETERLKSMSPSGRMTYALHHGI